MTAIPNDRKIRKEQIIGVVKEIQEGTNITVDNTDPERPIISASGGGGGDSKSSPRVIWSNRGAFTYPTSHANHTGSLLDLLKGTEEYPMLYRGEAVINSGDGITLSPEVIINTSEFTGLQLIDIPVSEKITIDGVIYEADVIFPDAETSYMKFRPNISIEHVILMNGTVSSQIPDDDSIKLRLSLGGSSEDIPLNKILRRLQDDASDNTIVSNIAIRLMLQNSADDTESVTDYIWFMDLTITTAKYVSSNVRSSMDGSARTYNAIGNINVNYLATGEADIEIVQDSVIYTTSIAKTEAIQNGYSILSGYWG